MKPKPLIPSPCIGVCTIEEDWGCCRGCFRTLEEITAWDRAADPERGTIVAATKLRQKRYEA
jgi:predicted Fe-S protein YdhL (DUF1289 family)